MEQTFNQLEERITEGLNNIRKQALENPQKEYTPLEVRNLHGLYFLYLTSKALDEGSRHLEIGYKLIDEMSANGYLQHESEKVEKVTEKDKVPNKRYATGIIKHYYNPPGKIRHSRPNKSVWPENFGGVDGDQ